MHGVADQLWSHRHGAGGNLTYTPKAFCICSRTWVSRFTSPPPTSAVTQPVKPISANASRTWAHGRSPAPMSVNLFVGSTEALDIQLHGAPAELAQPLTRLAIFPVVAEIVIHADPRAVEAVDELHEPFGTLIRWCVMIVEHVIPNILNQDHLS